MRLFGCEIGFRAAPRTEPDALEILALCGAGPVAHRAYDGAALAHGGVPTWIDGMRDYLSRRGVSYERVENIAASDGDRVAVDGRRYLVYLYNAICDWQAAIVGATQIVNQMLVDAGADERGFLLAGEGSAGRMVFLSRDAYDRVCASRRRPHDLRLIDVGAYERPGRDAANAFPAADWRVTTQI